MADDDDYALARQTLAQAGQALQNTAGAGPVRSDPDTEYLRWRMAGILFSKACDINFNVAELSIRGYMYRYVAQLLLDDSIHIQIVPGMAKFNGRYNPGSNTLILPWTD